MAELDDLRARIRADFAAEDSAKPLSPEHEDLAKRIRADFQADKDRQTAAMNVILEKAATFNPDKSASVQDLATKMELPVDYVERNEDAVRRQNLVQNTQRALVKSPVLAMQLTDPEFAKIAYDNVQSLGGIEEYVGAMARYVVGAQPDGGLPGFAWRSMGALAGGVNQIETAEWGGLRLVGDLLGDVGAPISSFAARKRQESEARTKRLTPQTDGVLASGWYSGMQSLGLNLAMLPLAFVPGAQPVVAGAAFAPRMAPLLSGMGIATGLLSYGQAREQNVGVLPSLMFGASQGVIEAGTEMLGMPALFSLLKPGKTLTKVVEYALKEQGGEQIATVLQDLNEWGVLPENKNKTLADYLKERPSASLQTAIATLVGGGGQVAVMKGLGHALNRADYELYRLQQSEEQARLLDGLMKLAASDKVLARNPESFQTYLQAMNPDDGPAHTLYFQASDLQETGVAQQLAQVSPSIAAQLPEALQTGGVVAVPVDEVLTNIAPTEYAQALVDIARVNDPTANNRREANEYRASEEGQALNEYVERQLSERQDDDAFTASRDAVKAQILADMNAVGRFSKDKNEVDAMAYASYYAVRAAQMGVTPEELYARRRVLFAGRAGGGFEQALAERPPKGWVHSSSGQDAAALFNGQTDAQAVFWTDLQGKLAQDAQALAQWRASLANMSPRNLDYAAKMDAPAVLQAMGVSARRLELPTRYLLAIHEKHPDVPQSVFENLPALLADLLFVYPHKDGGLNVVIDTKTADGDTIVVGVRDGRIRTITPRHGEGAMPVGLASALERRGTRIYARNKEALANARAASTGAAPATIAMHRDSRSAATITTREHIVNSLGGDFNQKARGSFNPETLTVSLLKGADLSTALHEGAHFFFENDIMLASEILAGQAQGATILPGEQEILNDVSALLKWHGIQGDLREQMAQWFNMSHEEKTAHHERTAESFERYLLDGKAPSLELQPYFQKFRAWMLDVYKSVRDFLAGHPEAGKLDDEVRQIFDRMLATSEQIKLAEESRSLMPLFTNPAESGMSVEDQGKYQSDQREATATAIDQLQARVLKDQQWRANARAREIKRLQRRHKALRAEMQIEARRQVLQAPIYRVYQFLTNKIGEEDKLPVVAQPQKTAEINPARDTLIEAIAKLGGVSRESAARDLGVHSDDYRTPSGVFGKPVFRKTGGLDADSMAELLAEHGYLRRDEHGKHDLRDLEDRVAAALGGSPEYSAFHEPVREMRPGEQAFGLDEIGAGRLDLGALQEMYGSGESPIQTLKSRRLTAKNGLHPDIVAELFGFDSGDQLARVLASVPTLAEAVQAATDQMMLERHGDLSTPEAIERAADMAVHNEARARLLAAETNALEQAVGKRKTLMPLAKQYAADIVARLTVRNLLPGRYTSAETRAAKLAQKAKDAGDLATAAFEKRNQMVQHYAARATYDAQDEVDAGLRYLRKFLRRRPKSLDADYAEQIEALLERYDLRQSSNKETDRRKSLRSWVMSQVANGEVPDIAMELLAPQDRSRFIAQTAEINEHGEYVYAEDGERAKLLADYIERAAKTGWRDLSVEQFRGLVETVKQIEHLGKLKNRLLTQKEGVLLDAVKDEIDESIRKNALKSGKAVPTRDDIGRRMQAIKRFGADHIRMAIRALVMDGGKDLGPMFRYFIQPANQAEGKQLDMRAAATERLNEIVTRALNGVPVADRVLKGRYYESVGASLNWQARFAILLNMGNEGNMQRLLSGGLGGRQNIALQDVMPILSEFTAEQLKAAQEIWDLMDSYRPELAELERETKGKEPEWIEPRRLTIRSSDGQMVTLRGGYFPVVYDPALNQRVADQQESEEASRAARAAKARSVTQQSFTKARANEVNGRPLLLTLDAVFSGIEAVIHDLSFRRYSIDAGKLLRSKRIQDAIREHYGAESIRQLRNFVDDLVAGPQRLNDSGEQASSFIRQNVSASGLALNVVNWMQQPFGIHNAVVRLGGGAEGAKWVGLGMVRYMKNPVAATREAMQASAFMKNRPRTRFRELNEIRNKVQFEGLRAKVTPFMMSGMVYSQLIADTIAWHAARARAVHENPAIDDESLIAVADQVVRDSQGGGEMVDLSAIERGSPMMKLFTVFFNFQNTGTNLAYLSLNTRRGAAKRAVDMFMVFVMPVLVNHLAKEIFRPGDDDKDKDEILKKLLVDQLTYLTGSFAFVREINTATEKLFGEGYGGYQGPSGLRPFVDLAKLAEQVNQGEMDDAMRKAIVNMAGDVLGAPSAAINRAITGAQALSEGKTENPLAIGFGFKERR